MTEYSTPQPLTKLPIRKFEHFRVTTRDAPPVPLQLLDDGTEQESNKPSSACSVCQSHESRYTCPRCGIPYCSVTCYQSHSDADSNADGESCTEGFYQDRVQSVVQLERKAKEQETHDMINRHYHEQQQDEDYYEDDEEGELEEEELLELLNLLKLAEDENEQHPSQHHDNQEQQLAALLAKSPKLKNAFEASLQSGEVQKLVLKPWNPWWRPVLSSSKDDATGTTTALQEEETLDERLLRIKPLESLLHKGKNSAQIPNLTFNLLELLYWAAYTLRLYHGVVNATLDDDTAVEAAMTFLQASSVLREDARYTCLEEVLMHITTTQQSKQPFSSSSTVEEEGQHDSWMTLLAQDVALIMAHRRMMGRALLEVLEILKVAISVIKKQQSKDDKPARQQSSSPPSLHLDVSELRRKRKKVEFYLSWSQHVDAAKMISAEQLPDEIRAWVEHWKPPATTHSSASSSSKEKVSLALEEMLCSATTPKPMRRNEAAPSLRHKMQEQNVKMIEVLD